MIRARDHHHRQVLRPRPGEHVGERHGAVLLAVDEDRWLNELAEEAIRDLLKKYREKRKEKR